MHTLSHYLHVTLHWLQMWDICLQLIDFAGSAVDAALVRQLWDHALLAAADHPESECEAEALLRHSPFSMRKCNIDELPCQ